MASFVPDNCESINGCDEYDTGALLMSQLLLDASHVEDCDDERLTSVIRSLEAEIEPVMLIEDNYESFMELEWDDNLAEFCDNNWSGEHRDHVSNGQDCSTTSSDGDLEDYNWMEMEDMNEFGGLVGDYYYYHYPQFINHDNINASSILEEQSYGSLWQDTDVLNYNVTQGYN